MFAGKKGFITLRDLFRWAERYHHTPGEQGKFRDWDQHLAEDGKANLKYTLHSNLESMIKKER